MKKRKLGNSNLELGMEAANGDSFSNQQRAEDVATGKNG